MMRVNRLGHDLRSLDADGTGAVDGAGREKPTLELGRGTR